MTSKIKDRTAPINISITKDYQPILEELDELLTELNLTRSLWFRNQMIKYVRKNREIKNLLK